MPLLAIFNEHLYPHINLTWISMKTLIRPCPPALLQRRTDLRGAEFDKVVDLALDDESEDVEEDAGEREDVCHFGRCLREVLKGRWVGNGRFGKDADFRASWRGWGTFARARTPERLAGVADDLAAETSEAVL